MKPSIPNARNVALLGLLAAFLAGCGGGGGGSSSATPASKSAAAFKNANLVGAFATPTKSHARGATNTVVTLQFADANTAGTGVASFVTGDASDPATFAAYAADVSNVDFSITSNTASGAAGTVDFDLTGFTANKYFASAHFKGHYTVSSSAADKVVIADGAFTGKDASGAATTANVSQPFGYQVGVPNIDLAGTYGGTISYALLGHFDFSGATLAKVTGDGLHLNASIPFTPPGSTTATTLAFKGAYTHTSLSGAATIPVDIAFNGLTIPAGTPAQVYLTTTDGAATVKGNLLVTLAGLGNVVLDVTGQKAASTGGGTTNLATGYYDGGVKGANGALDGRIVKLNVVKSSATVGANGAMVLASSGASPSVGGRIASVTGSGNNVTITVDDFTSTYTKWVLTGTVSGSSLNLTYTATLIGGTTETGSFDQLGKVDQTTPTLGGTYRGTLAATTGGSTAAVSIALKATGDGTVTGATTSTVLGGVPLPPLSGFIAGTSVALKDSSEGQTLPSPYTGSTLFGNFGGTISGNAITGPYVLFVDSSTGATLFVEYGTASLTKQ